MDELGVSTCKSTSSGTSDPQDSDTGLSGPAVESTTDSFYIIQILKILKLGKDPDCERSQQGVNSD